MAIKRNIEITIDGNGRSSIVDIEDVRRVEKEVCAAVVAAQNLRRTFSFESMDSIETVVDIMRSVLASVVISPLPDTQYSTSTDRWVEDKNSEYAEVVGLLLDYTSELDEYIVNNDTHVRYESYQSDCFTILLRLSHVEVDNSTLHRIVTVQTLFVGKADFTFTDTTDRSPAKRLCIHRRFTSHSQFRNRLTEFFNRQKSYVRNPRLKSLFEIDVYNCSIELDEMVQELFEQQGLSLRKTIEGRIFDVVTMVSIN